MSDDTGDIEGTGSTTRQLRSVRRNQESDSVRDEYRDKDFRRLEKSVYAQRHRVDSLEKRLPDSVNVPEMDRRMLKIEQAVALLKWIGGILGSLILTGLAAALFGSCHG